VRDLLKLVTPGLRAIGFRGSGQTYRKFDADFALVVNFQRSRSGDCCYVNLGAQPLFAPAEGTSDMKALREYECMLRRRVGRDWLLPLNDDGLARLQAELMSTQAEFFGHAQTLRSALAVERVEVLIQRFSSGTTPARATLNLGHAALTLGHRDVARALATRGLELAGEGATLLVSDLAKLLARLDDERVC